MLDIRFIRENAQLVAEKAQQKGYEIDVRRLVEIDINRRDLATQIEKVRAERNQLADKAKGGQPAAEDIEKGKQLKNNLTKLEEQLKPLEAEYDKLLKLVPNIMPDDTPLGGEEANREEKKWGEPGDKGFEVRDHQAWAEEKGLLDFERGAKVAGNKFYYSLGSLVELEIALLQFGLKAASEQGFIPMMVPHLTNARVINGAGFSARSADEQQIYKVQDEDLNLIATAEIPLTGYHADETLSEKDLPKLYAGYSPAYRKEAGAYGKHSRGLYRVHQFNKLELYVFCKPEDSEAWHQKMVALEEGLCQKLGLPYRVVRIAAGDLGAPAYKKYDIEYYSPVDKSYRELMSCSNVTDYQARRLNIKYKSAGGGTNYVHTLNGTAAAMSRMPIAIIENFQQSDGTVQVPKILKPYMGGRETL